MGQRLLMAPLMMCVCILVRLLPMKLWRYTGMRSRVSRHYLRDCFLLRCVLILGVASCHFFVWMAHANRGNVNDHTKKRSCLYVRPQCVFYCHAREFAGESYYCSRGLANIEGWWLICSAC